MADPNRGPVGVEQGAKRVRVLLGGETVADTTRPLLVWEVPHYPTYYLPAVDVRTDLLVDTGETDRSPSRGEAELHNVETSIVEADRAARWYRTPTIDELTDHIALDWSAMDAWFEEDEQVHVHARDPYTRVDILPSSRHVRIVVDGVEVANSHHPNLLYETGLPTRYYLPETDIRIDLLKPSDLETACPYKGTARHHHVDIEGRLHENIAWSYPSPVEESARVEGLIAFYDERVDTHVDGELQQRPRTKFARPER